MRRLADGVPDPETGANRAISSALAAKFTEVRVLPFFPRCGARRHR
jgi:hypothetical protein